MNLKNRMSGHTYKDKLFDKLPMIQKILHAPIVIATFIVLFLYLVLAILPVYWPAEEASLNPEIEFFTVEEQILEEQEAEDTQALINAAKQQVEKEGLTVNSPFSQSGLILWPDDLASRAQGCVVKTLQGFRFYNFSGWVKFSDNNSETAYNIEDGFHVLLPRRDNENAYYVSGKNEVQVYPNRLPVVHKIRFCGFSSYLDDNFWGSLIDNLLPDFSHSLLSCKPVVVEDTFLRDKTLVTNPIADLRYDVSDTTRLTNLHNSLNELTDLYASLDEGYTVAMSLFNGEKEAIVSVFGYKTDGSILIAGTDSKKVLGALKIVPMAEQTSSGIKTWFEVEEYPEYQIAFFAKNKVDTAP